MEGSGWRNGAVPHSDEAVLRRRDVATVLVGAFAAAPAPATIPAHAAESLTRFGRPVEVAPGIYVLQGAHEEASAGNADAIANVGFVVGDTAVAVIDPGGSLAHGRALRAMVEAATPLPVRQIVVTHVHPDHCMGAAAFADLVGNGQAEVIGHAALPAQISARAGFYETLLLRQTEGAAPGGTLMPTRLVEDATELDLGGRIVTLRAHGTAHTDHDLSLWDAHSGTLWLSDLLFLERCPSLDGSLLGWLARLDELRDAHPAARAVPGHGPVSVSWPDAATDLRRYLGALRDGTRAAIAAGLDIAEAPARVATEEAARWKLWEAYHGRNVSSAFRELEWE